METAQHALVAGIGLVCYSTAALEHCPLVEPISVVAELSSPSAEYYPRAWMEIALRALIVEPAERDSWLVEHHASAA